MPPTRRQELLAIRRAADLLGVGRGATIEDVIQARRTQAKLWHPDINKTTGSAERMGRINHAADLLSEYIRNGGEIDRPAVGVPRPKPARREPAQRVFEVRFEAEVSVPVSAPDRHARLEIDLIDALEGGTRVVHFVRREPASCHFCAGLGAAPTSPKRVCPDCDGDSVSCQTCAGRGWVPLMPGSCRHCGGTGAALVERTVLLKLPPGIRQVRRTMVRGWGDLFENGQAGNLWIDLVPTETAVRTSPWRFDHFGHNWPRPELRVEGDRLAITNSPLPDDEMRQLGFWRDPETNEWVRQYSTDGPQGILELIHQRQFFVPQAG